MAPDVAPIELLEEHPIGVDPAAIEGEFDRIWRETAGTGAEGATVRLRVVNLVAFARDDAEVPRFEEVMQVLPQRHPCRGILAHVDAGRTTLEATIAAHCWRSPGGARRHVCSEEVLLYGSPAQERELASAVLALLVSELPVAAWLMGAPDMSGYLVSELLEHADRLILDSARSPSPVDAFTAISNTVSRHGVACTDLAWERLTTWRGLAAQLFDGDDGARELATIRSIEVTGRPAEASLLAGWLASRLDLTPADVTASGDGAKATYYSGARGVRILTAYTDSTSIEALHVRTDDAEFKLDQDGESGHVHVRENWETGESHRTVEQRPADDAALVTLALDGAPDRDVYAASCSAAMVLLGA